jgi:hypothetical protein
LGGIGTFFAGAADPIEAPTNAASAVLRTASESADLFENGSCMNPPPPFWAEGPPGPTAVAGQTEEPLYQWRQPVAMSNGGDWAAS